MSPVNLRHLTRLRSLARTQRGLTLLEVVLAMAILLLILPLIFMMFSYVSAAFTTGEEQADLQQNLRLVTDYVVDELRFAEEVFILQEWNGEGRESYEYLYVIDGDVYHEKIDGDGESTVQQLVPEISQKVHIDLSLEPGDAPDHLLFTATGTRTESARSHQLISDIRLLNTEISGEPSGVAVEYKSPVPPSPIIKNVRLLHPDGHAPKNSHLDWHTGEDASVLVRVTTHQIPEKTDVDLYVFYIGDPGDPEETLVWSESLWPFDEEAEFLVEFDEEAPPGTYKIKAEMIYDEDEGESAVLTRSYVIEPTYTVSGTVSTLIDEEEQGVEGANIDLLSDEYAFETQTDAEGQYSLSGVPADDYTLTATHQDYESESVQVQVIDEDVPDIDVQLTPTESSE